MIPQSGMSEHVHLLNLSPSDFRFTEYRGVQVNPQRKMGKPGPLKPQLEHCAKNAKCAGLTEGTVLHPTARYLLSDTNLFAVPLESFADKFLYNDFPLLLFNIYHP